MVTLSQKSCRERSLFKRALFSFLIPPSPNRTAALPHMMKPLPLAPLRDKTVFALIPCQIQLQSAFSNTERLNYAFPVVKQSDTQTADLLTLGFASALQITWDFPRLMFLHSWFGFSSKSVTDLQRRSGSSLAVEVALISPQWACDSWKGAPGERQ